MPRAFLITHRRYNGVEEEITGSERGMLLILHFVTDKKFKNVNLIIINQTRVRTLRH